MEQDLVALAQSGDFEAFEKLVRQYEKSVYNIALRMSGNSEDAFDLSQEVFIRVYRTISAFKGDSSFSTWLFRVVSNICIDFARKQSKRLKQEQSFITCDTDGDEHILEVPDLRYSPETQYEKTELRENINNAFSKLSPEHRQILALREIAGLSYSEVACALSLEEGTVKSRIARSREQMRIYLTKEGNFFPKNSSKMT